MRALVDVVARFEPELEKIGKVVESFDWELQATALGETLAGSYCKEVEGEVEIGVGLITKVKGD